MMQKTGARRWLLNAVVALLVVFGVLWTSAAVLAQSSAKFSLGCWAVTTGGGDQRSSVNFRMRDAITSVGGEMQSASFRVRANHFALYPALNQTFEPAPQPEADAIFMPVIWARGLLLNDICK